MQKMANCCWRQNVYLNRANEGENGNSFHCAYKHFVFLELHIFFLLLKRVIFVMDWEMFRAFKRVVGDH